MDRTWTHTPESKDPKGAHAVEFSKTATPNREEQLFSRGALEAQGFEADRSL
jgi:hypothetical protein